MEAVAPAGNAIDLITEARWSEKIKDVLQVRFFYALISIPQRLGNLKILAASIDGGIEFDLLPISLLRIVSVFIFGKVPCPEIFLESRDYLQHITSLYFLWT